MKANEVRIGNYLLFPNGINKVESIEVGNFSNEQVIYACESKEPIHTGGKIWHCNINGVPIFTVEPIPMGADLLLKCGFEKDSIEELEGNLVRDVYKYKNLYYVVFDYEKGDVTIYFFYQKRIAKLNGFHHLQNIIFDLSGEELSVEL